MLLVGFNGSQVLLCGSFNGHLAETPKMNLKFYTCVFVCTHTQLHIKFPFCMLLIFKLLLLWTVTVSVVSQHLGSNLLKSVTASGDGFRKKY